MRWISFQWCNQDGPRVQTHLDNWKESVDGFFFFIHVHLLQHQRRSCEMRSGSPCVTMCVRSHVCDGPVCKMQRVWWWSKSGREVGESPSSLSSFIPFFFSARLQPITPAVFSRRLWRAETGQGFFTLTARSLLTSATFSEMFFFLEEPCGWPIGKAQRVRHHVHPKARGVLDFNSACA